MRALYVLLALPILLLMGAAAPGAWARTRFARAAGAFRCKVRVPYHRLAGVRSQWRRCRTYARWANDVLLIHHGLLRPRTLALPGRIPADVIRRTDAGEITGLGNHPVLLDLQLDDGEIVQIAARHRDRMLLVGPFLAAATPGQPRTTADSNSTGGEPSGP